MKKHRKKKKKREGDEIIDKGADNDSSQVIAVEGTCVCVCEVVVWIFFSFFFLDQQSLPIAGSGEGPNLVLKFIFWSMGEACGWVEFVSNFSFYGLIHWQWTLSEGYVDTCLCNLCGQTFALAWRRCQHVCVCVSGCVW